MAHPQDKDKVKVQVAHPRDKVMIKVEVANPQDEDKIKVEVAHPQDKVKSKIEVAHPQDKGKIKVEVAHPQDKVRVLSPRRWFKKKGAVGLRRRQAECSGGACRARLRGSSPCSSRFAASSRRRGGQLRAPSGRGLARGVLCATSGRLDVFLSLHR